MCRQATAVIGTRAEVLGMVTAAFGAGGGRLSKGLFDISFSSDLRNSAVRHRKLITYPSGFCEMSSQSVQVCRLH